MKSPNPFLLSEKLAQRKAGSRHQRRAIRAEAMKIAKTELRSNLKEVRAELAKNHALKEMEGKSIPALKKLLRRKK